MAYLKVLMCLLISILGFSKCAFVDTLTKCKLQDHVCHKDLIEKILWEISEKGVPEINISSIDPLAMKNIKFNILNVLELKFLEGTATGAKKCIVNKFTINVEIRRAYLDVTCSLVFQGKYDVKSYGDMLENFMGGAVHGNGDGKLSIGQINIEIEFPFDVEKRGDDIFLKGDIKQVKYTYRVLGNMTFEANDLWLGDKESSKELVKTLNDNWKFLDATFGKSFVDVVMKIVNKLIYTVISETPTNYFIEDDLTSYL